MSSKAEVHPLDLGLEKINGHLGTSPLTKDPEDRKDTIWKVGPLWELDLAKPAYLREARSLSLLPMQASEPVPPRMKGKASEGPTKASLRSSYRT